jgi:hypothetical protein
MSKFAIRLLTLATYATTLVVVPMVTPAEAETSSSRHMKKLSSPGFSYPRSASQAWAFTGPSNQAAPVCPGMGRSFDCKVWPPPVDKDPDRTISDGGGM